MTEHLPQRRFKGQLTETLHRSMRRSETGSEVKAIGLATISVIWLPTVFAILWSLPPVARSYTAIGMALAAVVFWRVAVKFVLVPVLPAMVLVKLAMWAWENWGDRALAGFSVRGLTALATLLAGRSRPALRAEWRAHLAGETGHDPVTWRKVRQAVGFVASAVQFRVADAADLAWRPADAVLGSRALSNLFVWGPVIVALVAIVHHDGRFGLVADVQDPAALGAFLYGAIRTGRWWRVATAYGVVGYCAMSNLYSTAALSIFVRRFS